MKPALQVGDDVIVSENGSYSAKVTKVARVYVTVSTPKGREWQFDKTTWSHRGEHCGYIPHLWTPGEHELHCAWAALRRAARDLPYAPPTAATVESVRRATAALLELSSPRPEPQHGDGGGGDSDDDDGGA